MDQLKTQIIDLERFISFLQGKKSFSLVLCIWYMQFYCMSVKNHVIRAAVKIRSNSFGNACNNILNCYICYIRTN